MHTTWANDPVNSPNHYTRSHPGMECIELTADTSFCLGNAIIISIALAALVVTLVIACIALIWSLMLEQHLI